jgi:hypothetical protein
MVFLYRFLSTYEPLIYISLAIFGLFAFRRMWVKWREWRDAVYSLEREFALWRLVRATAIGFLALGLFLAEFYIATFIAPTLSASDLLITPTLDLLATPQPTLGILDPAELTLTPLAPLQNGMSGCVPDKIMITSPKPSEVVKAEVNLVGTANVPNFGFYKYEVAPVGNTQNWATIAANREPKKEASLGKWNTLSVSNGDYFLRLVITDNVGNALEPCVIAVRVLNQ